MLSATDELLQERILEQIRDERRRQDGLWGQQNHIPLIWLGILEEEVGEFAREALDHHFEGSGDKNLRDELIQVAAVALAMLECCDRNKWIEE